VYDLAFRISSNSAGRFAICALLFFPTMILWSVSDLKDNQFIFFLVSVIWGTDRLISRKEAVARLAYLFFTLFASLYLITLRMKSMLPILAITFLTYFIYLLFRRYFLKMRCRTFQLLVFLFIFLLSAAVFKEKISLYCVKSYGYLLSINKGFLTSGGINYDLLSGNQDMYTFASFIKFLILSLTHFLLEPFIWNVTRSAGLLLFQPIVLLWYFLLFFSFVGIYRIIRLGLLYRIFFPLVLAFIFTASFSMSVSNIGTAIRIRDTLLPIMAIFASFAFVNIKKRKETP
ncbi:MAG: hypothetical protein JW788_00310, partial [Candidatus Omnitrophica bacterium]|nr:hypothetical protein [Candidatus Omnitrophota bacterium]